MDTKDDINILSAKIDELKESIRLKKESIEKEESELAELISEYNDYIKEAIKCIKYKKIRSISFKRFSYLLYHFSKEQGEYITEYNHDDVLTFFIEHKDGRISQLFDFKISTMIKEDGYCNYNFKDFILKRITTNLENNGSNSKIYYMSDYYMSDIDGDITEIVFNDNQRKYYNV